VTLTNKDIAQIFENIADMLEIKGESRFRFLSYRRAGETIGELERDLQAYVDDGTLQDIPGIGKAITDKTKEMLETGKLEFYERLKNDVPESLLTIMRINGVGPKKAKLFWEQLDITNVDELREAAQAGKLRDLPKMGAKSEAKILEGIEALSRYQGRTPIGKAKPQAERILQALLALPQAQEGIIAGSIRRGKTTIGDVDILIASDEAQPIMDAFVAMDGIARVLGHGSTKSSVELNSGLQVDVRVLQKKHWGTALQYFTGSKNHNVQIREIARRKGYSLNEEALSPIDNDGNIIADAPKVFCETEEKVYETLGLQWVAPELREDSGEIEGASNHDLPALITREAIRGDLHTHTTWSDGTLSIAELAEAAIERGLAYLCITDHSQRSVQANGLNVERLWQQRDAIQAVRERVGDKLHIYHGIEMDILEDGGMDYPDDVLAELDIVVASLHFSLKQDRKTITERMLNAIKNPHVDIIGHPTARLIAQREPADLDMDAILEAALEHQTALEINANPQRLDLDAQYVRRAMDMGILIAINTDAHSTKMLDYLPYGIVNARRGWTIADQVINTWTRDKLEAWLQR
jgi:DNA polymerase (family 10)